MYNNIPSERTSKRTIFVALLLCITLVSVLAAGYFAWVAKDLQTRIASVENNDKQGDLPERENIHGISDQISFEEYDEEKVFVLPHPQLIQPSRRTEILEGQTFLSVSLYDWEEANKDTAYCLQINTYAQNEDLHRKYNLSVREGLADEGIRATLVDYFRVKESDQEKFFAGIEQVIDEDDQFALGKNICSGGNGRLFLLLDDVRGSLYPEILEWAETSSAGFSWIVYPVSEYRSMDGYTFIPDWNGNVVLGTGYGDAGYAHWETQLLETSGGIPTLTLLEKCTVEPTEDYADSIMTCEVEYTE